MGKGGYRKAYARKRRYGRDPPPLPQPYRALNEKRRRNLLASCKSFMCSVENRKGGREGGRERRSHFDKDRGSREWLVGALFSVVALREREREDEWIGDASALRSPSSSALSSWVRHSWKEAQGISVCCAYIRAPGRVSGKSCNIQNFMRDTSVCGETIEKGSIS